MNLAQTPQDRPGAEENVRADEPATLDLARVTARWSVPVALLDPTDCVRAWNRGASTLYGISEERAIGQSWATLVAEETHLGEAVQLGPETRRYETRHRAADRRTLEVVVTRTELPAQDGGSDGAFLLITDLTASKTVESRLKRRIDQLSVIREIGEVLQSTVDLTGILRAILVGATASQGLRFNRAFLLLVDAKRSELRGRVAIGPSDPEEASRIWSELSRSETGLKDLLRTYEPYFERTNNRVNHVVRGLAARLDAEQDFLVRALRSPSTTCVVLGFEMDSGVAVNPDLIARLGVDAFVAVPLRAEGKPVGLLLADNGITRQPIDDENVELLEILGNAAALAIERAQLTRELEIQVASLEQATREIRANQERLLRAERLGAVGEMAARVAHEIRNPLVAIGGFARLLLREVPGEGAMRENVQIIVSEVRRLETILREVLDFSNPPTPRPGHVDLARIGLEALDLLQWEMQEAGVNGHLEAEPGLPEVEADRDQIFQAFINVMRNGIQVMHQGGELTLRVRKFSGWMEVAVEDTGPGIAPEVRARIFEPFFTTRSTGSGLGLTIAQQILREHRGEIQVDSRVGAGTTFYLRLPASAEGSADV